MSREIKFRAWIKDSETMVSQDDQTDYSMVSNGADFGVVFQSSEWLKKDGFEIMQFTGLKDKNGREIYEGDRVFVVMAQTIGEDFRGESVVEWSNHFGAWILDFPNLGQGIAIHVAEELEVLGNIHEGGPQP